VHVAPRLGPGIILQMHFAGSVIAKAFIDIVIDRTIGWIEDRRPGNDVNENRRSAKAPDVAWQAARTSRQPHNFTGDVDVS
jgi:hypothetical protein